MTKYDEAVSEAQAFTEKYRDASLPIMILIAKTNEDETDYFAIEKVATVTHFSEVVQEMVLTIAVKGNEIPAAQGEN